MPGKYRAGRKQPSGAAVGETKLRIIGGQMRGRTLRYHGDPRTRPMKERVREAIFNLIGPAVRDKHAIDLFAGTGAMGLEALSRGARRVTFVERHFPTARIIRENVQQLGTAEQAEVVSGSVFPWVKNNLHNPALQELPWLVFSCPPYSFYSSHAAEMDELARLLAAHAPVGSLLVIEGDERLTLERLPGQCQWQLRSYPPAVVALAEKETSAPEQPG